MVAGATWAQLRGVAVCKECRAIAQASATWLSTGLGRPYRGVPDHTTQTNCGELQLIHNKCNTRPITTHDAQCACFQTVRSPECRSKARRLSASMCREAQQACGTEQALRICMIWQHTVCINTSAALCDSKRQDCAVTAPSRAEACKLVPRLAAEEVGGDHLGGASKAGTCDALDKGVRNRCAKVMHTP